MSCNGIEWQEFLKKDKKQNADKADENEEALEADETEIGGKYSWNCQKLDQFNSTWWVVWSQYHHGYIGLMDNYINKD
jgi:hypothetical protein